MTSFHCTQSNVTMWFKQNMTQTRAEDSDCADIRQVFVTLRDWVEGGRGRSKPHQSPSILKPWPWTTVSPLRLPAEGLQEGRKYQIEEGQPGGSGGRQGIALSSGQSRPARLAPAECRQAAATPCGRYPGQVRTMPDIRQRDNEVIRN